MTISFVKKLWKNRDDPTLDKSVDPELDADELNRHEAAIDSLVTEVNTLQEASGTLADDSVTTSKIADLAVTDAKIDDVAASKVTVADAGGVLDSTDVEGALQEVATRSAGATTTSALQAAAVREPFVFKSRGTVLLDPTGGPEGTTQFYPKQIIYDGGKYHLMYQAGSSQLGTAWSAEADAPDGPYTNRVQVDGLPTNGVVDHPCYVRDAHGVWHCFYGTTAAAIPHYTADDLLGPYTLANTQVLAFGASGAWDEHRLYEPWVFPLADGSGYGMIYMGEPSSGAVEQIGLATAPSLGGPWTKASGNPIVPNGDAGSYDHVICADPFLHYVNGYYALFYDASSMSSGGDTSHNAYALATSKDLATWEKHGVMLATEALPAFAVCRMHRGSFYLHTDGYVYFVHMGASSRGGDSTSAAVRKIVLDVIDPVSFVNFPKGDPWIQAEAEDNTSVLTTGSWTKLASAPWLSGGAALYSNTAGSRVKLLFTGRRVRWYTVTASQDGIANVYLDGALVATRDLYVQDPGTNGVRSVVIGYESDDLPPGAHQIEVECSGDKNAAATNNTVFVDKFEYLP